MLESRFIGTKEAFQRAAEDRKKVEAEKLPKYHLPFFSHLLAGMMPSELVVLGADTGIGKTHLANHVAFENAKHGKKVYLFSLEGHKHEVVNRMKWNYICSQYYKKPSGLEMNYSKYEMNLLPPEIETLDEEASSRLQEILNDNLFLFDRSSGLDIELLTAQMGRIRDANLVVIDHLHYFDMIDDTQETQHISKIMLKIKQLTEDYGIPVLLVSHLRKKMKGRGHPDNEDFMGSSNIPKVATTCLLVSSMPDKHDTATAQYATLFRISKSRAGAPSHIAAQVMFDNKVKRYKNTPLIGKFYEGQFTEMPREQWPLEFRQTSPFNAPSAPEEPTVKLVTDVLGATVVQKNFNGHMVNASELYDKL